MAVQPAFASAVNNGVVRISGTTEVESLITAATNGTWVRALNVYSSCAAVHLLRVYLNSGGVDYKLFTVSIPAGVGSSGPSLNIMDPAYLPSMDPHPNRGILLEDGEFLKVECLSSALSANEEIDVVAFAGDF
jgi:hypothetical protein